MTILDLEHKEVVNLNSTVKWMENGIVCIQWKHNADITISDIDELEKAFKKLTGGEKVRVIQNMGKYVNMNPDARKYASTRAPELIGVAYVISGLGQRLAVSFYIRIRTRKHPTKVFSSLEDAAEWLIGL